MSKRPRGEDEDEGPEDPNWVATALESPFPPKTCHSQGGVQSLPLRRWLHRGKKTECINSVQYTDPGECQCVGCEPERLATEQHRYFHRCGLCYRKFRCMPSVPVLVGGPVALNKPCRCHEQNSRHFCSNSCYWKCTASGDSY